MYTTTHKLQTSRIWLYCTVSPECTVTRTHRYTHNPSPHTHTHTHTHIPPPPHTPEPRPVEVWWAQSTWSECLAVPPPCIVCTWPLGCPGQPSGTGESPVVWRGTTNTHCMMRQIKQNKQNKNVEDTYVYVDQLWKKKPETLEKLIHTYIGLVLVNTALWMCCSV